MIRKTRKTHIREKFKVIRRTISPSQKQKMDIDICYNILVLEECKNADIVLCYIANKLETDLKHLIYSLWKSGKKVAVPKCIDDGRSVMMDYYIINDYGELAKGCYGIMEPDPQKCEMVNVKDTKLNTVMILPGIVYDREGYRIGYGRGYYDRYIFSNNYQGIKIGVCYEGCIIRRVDRWKYDVNVDILISDKKTRFIMNKVDEY